MLGEEGKQCNFSEVIYIEKDYKISNRMKLFDLSKISKFELTKDVFSINLCPYCNKLPKAFYEGRFIRDEHKRRKWIYDGIYVVVRCKHLHKIMEVEKKCITNISRTLLGAIYEWNKKCNDCMETM